MIEYRNMGFNDLENINANFIKTNKKIEYINLESSLDIETSSTYVHGEKVAFTYIWMFGLGLGQPIYYGRTWDELLEMLGNISAYYNLHENRRLVIYVHNLGYEFQFMRKYFDWLNVFAINERKPIKALCSLGIEFRCSYILSGYSLANTAKNLHSHKIDKKVGDLDYSLIRTPKTELTTEEMGYCESDIEIVLAYINEQIEQYGDINRVPLTNTGRVRTFVKNNCYYSNSSHKKSDKGKFTKYKKIMSDLTLTEPEYIKLKNAFMGGFTHSNPNHTNKTLTDVDSIDLCSSYPTVMLSDMFPMSKGRELKFSSLGAFKEAMKQYCMVFELKLVGVKNKIGYESYISESKCFSLINPTINNGRVYEADELSILITDVDFNIIEQVYSWDEIAISDVTGFYKNYLPKSIIESILQLYGDKTELKDVKGSEVEYLLSKGMLNSVYGMSVTDFIKDDHVYNESWEVEKVDVTEKVKEYNESKTRFLFYPWGIWVTAYARRNLWSAILAVGEDYIYSDTDSVKMLNYDKHKSYVEKYNQHVTKKLELMMDYYSLDKKLLAPKTITNKSKPLGVWDYEGHYTKFKTLGAKRYLVLENGHYHITVAGLSKKNGVQYLIDQNENDADKIFKAFDNNLYVPAEKTGKMTHTYIDDEKTFIIKDYKGNDCYIHELSGIHLENCDFTLTQSSNYLSFLENLKNGFINTGKNHI